MGYWVHNNTQISFREGGSIWGIQQNALEINLVGQVEKQLEQDLTRKEDRAG